MAKKLKSLLRTGLLILAGLAVGINIYLWNARTLLGNAMPMPFGYGIAVVLSGSMEPTIAIDDLILVSQAESYAQDDIVVYQSGNVLVVHRILEVQPDTVITQGDANNTPDAPVRKEMIKGKVIACISGAGALARVLKSPVVTFSLLAAAILSVELGFRKEKEKKADELEKIKEEIRKLKSEQE